MISYVFGSPGAGKTTYACKLALDAYRKNRRRVDRESHFFHRRREA